MKKSELKQIIKEEIHRALNENESLTNKILDKISQSGISSLTDFERQYLDKISNDEDVSSLKMNYLKNI